jgi:zinc transporter
MDSDGGLIYSYLLDGKGSGKSLSWQEIKKWNPEKGTIWLHLDYTNDKAVQWLRDESGISPIICEALMEEETRPRVLTSDDGLLLILRGVNFNPGSDPEDMVSLRLWFDKNRIISMRHRKVMAIDDIKKALESSNGPDSQIDFLKTVVERITDRMGDIVSEIDDTVDELEDSVLTAESYELRSKLAVIRRQTISLRRYIAPQRDVLTRLYNERISWLSDQERAYIREIAERTTRYVEDLDSARDRAAITNEELNSRLSEQMNKTMYIISLVAAIFLPLGFLTGLLGINVAGIPGSDYSLAFLIVCIIIAAIAFIEYWLFRRKRWL